MAVGAGVGGKGVAGGGVPAAPVGAGVQVPCVGAPVLAGPVGYAVAAPQVHVQHTPVPHRVQTFLQLPVPAEARDARTRIDTSVTTHAAKR